jgi:hypothetical protein
MTTNNTHQSRDREKKPGRAFAIQEHRNGDGRADRRQHEYRHDRSQVADHRVSDVQVGVGAERKRSTRPGVASSSNRRFEESAPGTELVVDGHSDHIGPAGDGIDRELGEAVLSQQAAVTIRARVCWLDASRWPSVMFLAATAGSIAIRRRWMSGVAAGVAIVAVVGAMQAAIVQAMLTNPRDIGNFASTVLLLLSGVVAAIGGVSEATQGVR